MAQPSITQSALVKRDLHVQLHRVSTSDGATFLVKVAVSDLGGEELLLENEFRRFEKLASKHTLRPQRLSDFQERPAAYYENVEGSPMSLEGVVRRGDWDVVRQFVHDACAPLRAFHEHGLVLVGLSPKSFLRTSTNPQLLVIDAPFAQESGRPFASNENLWINSSYLAYAAPEALGSRATTLDPRADLYALGAILYELFSGRRPFDGSEPARLIQSHLARQPRSLAEVEPAVPRTLSDLILRLLAKAPHDRFDDLDTFERKLAQALTSTSGRFPRYARAPETLPSPPPFSRELYGRHHVLDVLRAKLRRARTTPALVILRGDAGIGKTTLLLRLQEQEPGIVACRGKFEQSGPVTPLAGWAGALRQLANAILTKPPEDVEAWRAKLLDSLGDGAALLGGLVPEWNAILRWEGSSVDTLEATLNRLALAIHRLLRAHAAPDAPVLLVLDDLQWADPSSLRILELVLTLPEPLNLLVVAGARNAQSGADQAPLVALEASLAESGVDVERVDLSPLSPEELERFLRDSFAASIEELPALAALLLARTDGNPFFVREFLSSLVQRRALTQPTSGEPWSWQRDAATTIAPGGNVIDFLSRKVLVLPQPTQDALRVGACLGPGFFGADWRAVTAAATCEPLEAAVTAGILVSTEVDASGERHFEFVHDRVLETCRSLTSADERAALSIRIARTLLAKLPAELGDERFYRLAGHFEAGRSLMTDPAERHATAQLALEAGRRAKSRGAFSQALEHLLSSAAFSAEPGATSVPPTLPEEVWQERFEFALSLHEQAAEAALLNGRLDLVHPFCREVLLRAPGALRKVFAYDVLIRAYNGEKNFSAAADTALEILRELGVTFPKRPTPLHALYGFWRTRRRLLASGIDALSELPAMTNPTARAVAGIIQTVYSPAYLSRPALFPLIVFRHVDDSLQHGNQEYSGVTYNGFALVLAGFGDSDRAMALGQMGLRLLERFPQADRLRAKAVMGHYSFVFPWKNHIRDTLPFYEQGLKSGLEHGDFEYACFIMTLHTLARLHSGAPLAALDEECERYRAKIAALKQMRSVLLQGILSQIVHELRREEGATPELRGPHCDERESLPQYLDPIDHNLLFEHYLAKLMLGVLLGERDTALEAARLGRKHLAAGAFAIYIGPIFVFYESLAKLTLPVGDRRAGKELRFVARGQARLARQSRHAPMNFAHKLHLIEAEAARLRGRTAEAAEFYDKAMELAQTHGFVHELALAQERTAAFYFERGMERLGRHYLREAYASYRRWGATAILRRLEREHPQHLALLAASQETPGSGAPRHITESLDYRLLLKSSQAISGEILIPRLLERLLKAMLEHAAGQRGLLLLERRGELFIEAETDVDRQEVEFPAQESLESSTRLCHAIAHYTARTGKPLVLADAANEGLFVDDPYVQKHGSRSILCSPIHYQGKLLGLAYLENNRVSHVFTRVRVELIELLAGQAAISVANARFHALKLDALQARINPHFLFNALSSIAELSVTHGATAETAILKLARLYRYILDSSADTLVPLEQELHVVQDYLELEKLRFGSRLTFSVTTTGQVPRATIPGLLVQPLVENSIRHGIAPGLKPGNVWVHATIGETTCSIVVQDDGEGSKHATAGAGFGLRSVQERLELVYGKDYSLAITQRGGYRVEVEIPLRSSTEGSPPPSHLVESG